MGGREGRSVPARRLVPSSSSSVSSRRDHWMEDPAPSSSNGGDERSHHSSHQSSRHSSHHSSHHVSHDGGHHQPPYDGPAFPTPDTSTTPCGGGGTNAGIGSSSSFDKIRTAFEWSAVADDGSSAEAGSDHHGGDDGSSAAQEAELAGGRNTTGRHTFRAGREGEAWGRRHAAANSSR